CRCRCAGWMEFGLCHDSLSGLRSVYQPINLRISGCGIQSLPPKLDEIRGRQLATAAADAHSDFISADELAKVRGIARGIETRGGHGRLHDSIPAICAHANLQSRLICDRPLIVSRLCRNRPRLIRACGLVFIQGDLFTALSWFVAELSEQS